MTETVSDTRDETPDERADRNWAELLQELRVSQIGVQLLAASLVTLPFQSRFSELDTFQVRWYLGLLALALLTVGVTLAPVAIHRRLFQAGGKAQTVRAAHLLATLAIAMIALLLAGIAFFVVDLVLAGGAAAGAGLGGLVVELVLLVVIPRAVEQRVRAEGDAQST